MKSIARSFGIVGSLLLIATAFALSMGNSASAQIFKPTSVDHYIPRGHVHTFIVHHHGITTTETCQGVSEIGKSAAYPGYIEGRAWVVRCAPEPAETCSQTADMQVYDRYAHRWDNDGDGKPNHGCAGATDAGIIRKNCHQTSEAFSYRAYGIFVVVDALGDVLDWGGPSGQMTVIRVC